uniref:Uncharacterized protein n=1 Tax=Cacopsylla melanoneura TaxID=428564 RepID=A0A8D8Z4G8_9HEMI
MDGILFLPSFFCIREDKIYRVLPVVCPKDIGVIEHEKLRSKRLYQVNFDGHIFFRRFVYNYFFISIISLFFHFYNILLILIKQYISVIVIFNYTISFSFFYIDKLGLYLGGHLRFFSRFVFFFEI